MVAPEFVVRKAIAHDVPLIFSGWLNSWRTNKHAGVIRNNDFYEVTRAAIEDLIARGATLLVADAGKTLLGFACGEEKDGQTVLHYVWTKDVFRNFGVEDALIAALPGTKPGFFTFFTNQLDKASGWRWAPEMARRKTL